MLTNERQAFILKLLEEKHTVEIQDLVNQTAASESTIRRDLTELENEGKLQRVFGGAVLLGEKNNESKFSGKKLQNLHEKIRIAQFAASFVEDGDSVFLDGGTTTFQMIPFLQTKDIVVVTNDFNLVRSLNDHKITAYLTGGFAKKESGTFIGSHTLQSLERYRFDHCFLGVNGVDANQGYTVRDPEEAEVKKLAASLSRNSYVLADNSKLNSVSFGKIMDLEKAVLVVDQLSAETLADIRKKTMVKVVDS